MKRAIALVLSLVMMFSLAACGSGKSASSSSGAVDGKGVKLLLALHDETDTFLTALVAAMEEQAAACGAQMDIVYAENSVAKQKEQISQAASGGYDAIICRLADASTAKQMETAAGNLPILFINNQPDESALEADKYVYVASYEKEAGLLQAEYVWNKLGKPSSMNIIILKGQKGHSAVNPRSNAVRDYLRDNGVAVNIVFMDYADWSDTTAYDKLELFKLTGQSFDAVFANNDPMAIGAINWMKDNGYDTHKYLVAGIDATDGGKQAVRDGDMCMTVLQDTAGQGTAAVNGAIALAKGQSLSGTVDGATEDGLFIWVPFVTVDSSNVDQY